jgi:porin
MIPIHCRSSALIFIAASGVALAETPIETVPLTDSASGNGGAQSRASLGGPNSVAEELKEDRIDSANSGFDRWNLWKERLDEDYGLQFSFEYNAMMQVFSDAGAGDDFSAGGIARFFGSWNLFDRGGDNPGSLVFRVDHRHSYTDLDPQTAGIVAGSAVPTASLFTDREWGLVNLQWSQTLFDGRGGIIFGFTPADDYFHAYALANVLTGFSNLSFSTGGVIAIPDTGIGLAGGGMLGENWYFKAGIHDANGSASDPSFDVFGDWEFYKNLEVGWTSSQDKLFLDNFHLGVWHIDSREDVGVPEDWGMTFNASWYFEDSERLPFIRGGWSDGKVTLLDGMVSAGVGKKFCERDLAGLGLSWGSSAAPGQGDQWSTEIFYRKQLRNFAITPSIQVIVDSAGNPDEDVLVVGGLRARVVY